MKSEIYLREVAQFIIAAWILPNGKILDVGALHHINLILKNPKKFGLSKSDVGNCIAFADAPEKGAVGEVLTFRDGIEAGAQEMVINKVIEKGFIRLRRVRAGLYSFIWYADVSEFNHRAKKLLSDLAYNMLNDKNAESQVMISTLNGEDIQPQTLQSLANLVESHEILQLITLEEMEDLI